MKNPFSPSLLMLLSSLPPTAGREYTRRRLANDHETKPQTPRDYDSSSSDRPSFYDLSRLTQAEKLQMIQAAISVNKLGDSIDWNEQRDKFHKAVWNDLGGSKDADEDEDESFDGYADDVTEIGDRDNTDQIATTRRLQSSNETSNESSSGSGSSSNIDGDVFDQYEYSTGNCPDAGSLGVPCAPDNLSQLCNKYDRGSGSFSACLDACAPAFCCVHDADRELNFMAPNCNTDENCAGYNWCYIAWWKLHDTIGPALFLRIEQDDAFYDITGDEIAEDVTGDPLFEQILLHHFDDIQVIIDAGTVDGEFTADTIFLDPEYWDTDI